tara:strand:- start:56 stop:235 length:180 start_codon:yes stop_codon:yes gene_type:complete
MLSRKHYRAIASIIKDSTINNDDFPTINKNQLINDLSIEFKKDNSLFNRDRFVNACNDE